MSTAAPDLFAPITSATPVADLQPTEPQPTESPSEIASRVYRRLNKEGRWTGQAEHTKNEMLKAAAKAGMNKADAKAWAYSELDRIYPPSSPPNPNQPLHITSAESGSNEDEAKPCGAVEAGRGANGQQTGNSPAWNPPPAQSQPPRTREDSGIRGLGQIPATWPELASSAQLQVELAWVQSNRLCVVEEVSPSLTVIHLERARSPAPSHGALGWLETSVRSYAKFVDILGKTAAGSEDGDAHVRRERMAIEEIRAMLSEMIEPEA